MSRKNDDTHIKDDDTVDKFKLNTHNYVDTEIYDSDEDNCDTYMTEEESIENIYNTSLDILTNINNYVNSQNIALGECLSADSINDFITEL